MGRRGRYWTPPTEIRDVARLTREPGDTHWDVFTGTAEAFVASGLLRLEQLPGQPGLPKTVVTYRPIVDDADRDGWYFTPGYCMVRRKLDDVYRMQLAVSREERRGREAIKAKEDEKQERLRQVECLRYEARRQFGSGTAAAEAYAMPRDERGSFRSRILKLRNDARFAEIPAGVWRNVLVALDRADEDEIELQLASAPPDVERIMRRLRQ